MKKVVLVKHKNQEIYPATYSLAIIHKGELLYDVLDKKLQPDSLKTINNLSLIGPGNINIQGGGGSIFGDHLFPHTATETDIPIRFIGFKGNNEDSGYTGDNFLKIGNDHAQLSGKYTLNSGYYSLFNFNAAGFDFKRFDETSDLKTRFSVKNDNIYLSGRHVKFLCLNKNDLLRGPAIVFSDYDGELYAHFGENSNLNRFRVKTESGGLFVLNEDGVLTEHNEKIRFRVNDTKFNIKDKKIEFKWHNNSHILVLNQNGIEGELKGIKYNFNGGSGILRINGNDRVAIFGMEHGGHTNYTVFNNDIHVGSDPSGSVENKVDFSNDIIKIKSDGKVFVKGIGEFDGTNADTAQSLQEAIVDGALNEEASVVIAAALNDLNDRLLAIENANAQNV